MSSPVRQTSPQQSQAVIPVGSWLSHAALWAGLCAAGLAGAWLLQRALYFGGTPPVPMRVNPTLFSASLAGVPVVLLGLWVSCLYTSRLNIAFALATLFLGLCFAGLLASLSPGQGTLVAREVIPATSLRPKQTAFAYVAYFNNGEPGLELGEQRRIIDALSVFRACEAGSLQVHGFASSARYLRDPSKSAEYNKNLANQRASVVKKHIEDLAKVDVTAKQWESYEEMARARRLRDEGLSGERLLPMEKLNRRVEIVWNDSRCTDGEAVVK